VQGVGFRPCVYALATAMGLGGYVANTSGGVIIEVEGPGAGEFPDMLREGLPPLAHLTSLSVEHAPSRGYEGFEIRGSLEGEGFTLVSADVSTCQDCLEELADPSDRRYRYPFINCTNCGPRYTITTSTPYDRPNTTMSAFTMCPECLAEYYDPSNRRFHAVPNACPACGPRVWLVRDGAETAQDDPVGATVEMLRQGRILAIKGLGGFHLACDALNSEAVADLRERKQRVRKPFALMARDVETVRRYCEVSDEEEELLLSARRPVVLLAKKGDCALPEDIAPGNRDVGFMLPYTPLHRLLMDGLEVAVMTSGNMSEEPIQCRNQEALEALAPLADAFLLHDRDIFMRVDDPVVRVTHHPLSGNAPVSAPDKRAILIRRARGYAPEAIGLASGGPDVLAVGADMKNTFTFLKDDRAVVSQHMGDMDKLETVAFFEETLRNLRSVYRASPVALAHDMHPGYGSTRWAMGQEMPKLAVQHHHAHIVSVMAEHRLEGHVLGVALDGTGYGPDGTLWGGEFLLSWPEGFERLGHFGHIRLPGGERAIKEPWRIAVGVIDGIFGADADDMLQRLGFIERFGEKTVADVRRVAGLREFSPPSSGAGRLFDAASSLLGLCDESSFEGEAAMALEGAAFHATGGHETECYPFDIAEGETRVVDMGETFRRMVLDMAEGCSVPVVAMRFHSTVARAVGELCSRLSAERGIGSVALSGGVFQNVTLMGLIMQRLASASLTAYTNRLVPPNDAGISLGQAVILRHQIDKAR